MSHIQADSQARHRLVGELFTDIVERCAPADWDAEAVRRTESRPEILLAVRQLLAAHALVSDGGFSRGLREALAATWESAAMELSPGARLDAWVVIKEVGQGGMGRVYLARRDDGLIDQQVAIKVARWRSSPRLTREAQLLERLDHPAIVRLLDVGTLPDGPPYVVMEYIDGLPLPVYLQGRQRPEHIIRLLLSVVDAVAHAHARLVLHRDIKPSNILVDQAGEAHLLDFGVADLLAPGAGAQHALGHTPAYAAPELAHGLPGDVGVDIYALGVTLREAIADAPLERARAADLHAVLSKASAEDPADRYASASALAEDLRCWLAYRPVSARASTPWQRFRLWRRRHPAGAPLATAVALSLCALTASLGSQHLALIEQRDLAEAQRCKALSALAHVLEIDTITRPQDAEQALARLTPAVELAGLSDCGIAQASPVPERAAGALTSQPPARRPPSQPP